MMQEVDNVEIAEAIRCDVIDLTKNIQIKNQDLTIVTQNIRSVYSNIDDLIINLCNLNMDIDIIVLTECRLDTCKPLPCISNYSAFATTHHVNQNDGVVIYIKNTIKAKVKEIKLRHASCLRAVLLTL